MYIENFAIVDASTYYLTGWLWDSQSEITQLTAVSPEGARIEILDRLIRYSRNDAREFFKDACSTDKIATVGFFGSFALPRPSHLQMGWIIEMRTSNGTCLQQVIANPVTDPQAIRALVINDLALVPARDTRFIAEQSHPIINKLQQRPGSKPVVTEVIQYGTSPSQPAVSVVIPLYQRINFLEQQLAQFALDPQIAGADLIYVLDSPELANPLRKLCPYLYELYRVPFRLAILDRNSGYAAANNAGISLAQGRLLLLLNSDVIPDKPGWLQLLTKFYDETPLIGALGPKLLYEDDTIQHAGMYFQKSFKNCLWENQHFFKGMHRRWPAAEVSRPVPAVTGACLMISRALYNEMGGLSGQYVKGDYEDSDLCLRLFDAGRQNWYVSTPELYHLEAQSYAGDTRRFTSYYNCWLHTQMWGEKLTSCYAAYSKGKTQKPELQFAFDQIGFRNALRCGTINYFDGWAVNLDKTNPVQHIRFSVDSQELGRLPIRKERRDLEAKYGTRLVGFSGVIDTPESCLHKTLKIEAVTRDGSAVPMKEYALELSLSEDEKRYRGTHQLPDDTLIHLVVHSVDYQEFVEKGKAGVELIKANFQKHNIALSSIRSILDFGVGCGRVFRWWKDHADKIDLWGTDVNPQLVDWCTKHIDFGHFTTNSLHPPTEFQENQFDLIYAFSVFTHLAADTQCKWLGELHRILAPGGHLLVSVHGGLHAERLPTVFLDDYRRSGFVVVSQNAEGENMCAAYQTKDYSTRLFSKWFDVLDCSPSALTCCGNQDLYLLRKRK